VADPPPPELSPQQASRLKRLLEAGFQFLTFEQFARYPAVEKAGFVALLDLSAGRVTQFGSVGYRVGSGIGVLVERDAGQAFVHKQESVAATPKLLSDYHRVKQELAELLTEPKGA
jgi:hypothetical protein